MKSPRISLPGAIGIFSGFTAYFYFLLFTLLKFLQNRIVMNPATYWFITAYFLFLPLFFFAVLAVRSEGARGWSGYAKALNIRRFSKNDWTYSIGGLLLVFACTGGIFRPAWAAETAG